MKKIIYALIDPTTSLPFYIGLGTPTRPNHHLKTSSKENQRKIDKIKEIRSNGYEPKVLVLHDNLSIKEAKIYETIYILLLGRIGHESDGILTNLQPGGAIGNNWNKDTHPEQYKNVANHCRENNRNPEIRKKNSEAQKRKAAEEPLWFRHNWRYWYISPYGCFSSVETDDILGFKLNISGPKFCDKRITKIAYIQCQALKSLYSYEECFGKTYREMGFYYKER